MLQVDSAGGDVDGDHLAATVAADKPRAAGSRGGGGRQTLQRTAGNFETVEVPLAER
jgi:hypothetical protein